MKLRTLTFAAIVAMGLGGTATTASAAPGSTGAAALLVDTLSDTVKDGLVEPAHYRPYYHRHYRRYYRPYRRYYRYRYY